MTDPFEEVEPAMPLDAWQVLTAQLSRSTLWDMVGPYWMTTDPELFGQSPASPDVIDAEAKEMWERKNLLIPFGMDLQLLSFMAAEAASLAILKSDTNLDNMPESDKIKFRASNVKLATAVAESVISHMLQKRLIQYGEQDEFLGE